MLRYNGSAWVNEATPYVLKFAVGGTPTASQFLGGDFVVNAAAFAANFSGSRARAVTAPTSSYAIDVQKNGASIGTITFAGASNTATFATSGGTAQSVVDGDYIELFGAATPDATIANIYVSLEGTRS
jgi:hypothetical protein